jgi:hypothetical protein
MREPVAVPGVDPSRVNTPADLASCLDGLRRRRDLSYEAMDSAATELARQASQKKWEPLAKSTVGEIVKGRRLPTKGKLLTFLAVCRVSAADVPQWLAAWERASTANLAKPAGAVRVADTRPGRLGVHAAIQVADVTTELPTYIPRDIDGALRSSLAAGAQEGCFILLVGGSSVGKTRTLYEGILSVLPSWWLIQPATAGEIRALVQAPTSRTIVWLDDMHQYLGAEDDLAATIRTLLNSGMVIVGTVWSDEYLARVRLRSGAGDNRHDADKKVLELAQIFDLPPVLSPDEEVRARELAATDKRLKVALDTVSYGLTQVLAAGPALVRWWENSPDPFGAAVITAAVDARRLGMRTPVTRSFLAAAIPGYLTARQRALAPENWLDRALNYAMTPLYGAASALSPVDAGEVGKVSGFTVADYLVHHGLRARRTACPPESLWKALVAHVEDPRDMKVIVGNAMRRMRYCYAIEIAVSHPEVELCSTELGDVLIVQGRIEDLRALADNGTPEARYSLSKYLVKENRIEELRARGDAGDMSAEMELNRLLFKNGDTSELRKRAESGDSQAMYLVVSWLLDRNHGIPQAIELIKGREHEHSRTASKVADRLESEGNDLEAERIWRVLKEAGSSAAAQSIAELLARQGRYGEAIDAWRALADSQYPGASDKLASLLAKQGLVDELRERANSGDESAGRVFADVLRQQGRIGELRTLASGGNHHATWSLNHLLADEGHIDELRSRADNGDDHAASALAVWLANNGALKELRARAETGDSHSQHAVALKLSYYSDLKGLMTWAEAGNVWAGSEIISLITFRYIIDDADAIKILRQLVALGVPEAPDYLVDRLCSAGQYDEAIEVLRQYPDLDGVVVAAELFPNLLAAQGNISELRKLADERQVYAASELADWLAQHDHVEELRDRAREGDENCAGALAGLYARRGELGGVITELNAGTRSTAELFIELLEASWRISETEVQYISAHGLDASGTVQIGDSSKVMQFIPDLTGAKEAIIEKR